MNVYIPFLFVSLVCAAAIFLISRFGGKRGWYQRRGNWFSRIMHFSGGFLVAMFWSGFIRYWLSVIALTFFVGVVWETGEYLLGIFMKKRGRYDMMPQMGDTIEDLIMDVTGAAVWMLVLTL